MYVVATFEEVPEIGTLEWNGWTLVNEHSGVESMGTRDAHRLSVRERSRTRVGYGC